MFVLGNFKKLPFRISFIQRKKLFIIFFSIAQLKKLVTIFEINLPIFGKNWMKLPFY